MNTLTERHDVLKGYLETSGIYVSRIFRNLNQLAAAEVASMVFESIDKSLILTDEEELEGKLVYLIYNVRLFRKDSM